MQRTVATSFDLFGTLVSADRPAEPATAVADALRERDVTVPADWATAYREPQFDAPTGAEHSLATHVAAALETGTSTHPNPQSTRRPWTPSTARLG